MSTRESRFFENLCPTCLSQDRRLFPLEKSRILKMFYKQLQLKGRERVCWECRAILHKVVVFCDKALQAQQVIKDFSVRMHDVSVESLSDLKIYHTLTNNPMIDKKLWKDDYDNYVALNDCVKLEDHFSEDVFDDDYVDGEQIISSDKDDDKMQIEKDMLIEIDGLERKTQDNVDNNKLTEEYDHKINTQRSKHQKERYMQIDEPKEENTVTEKQSKGHTRKTNVQKDTKQEEIQEDNVPCESIALNKRILRKKNSRKQNDRNERVKKQRVTQTSQEDSDNSVSNDSVNNSSEDEFTLKTVRKIQSKHGDKSSDPNAGSNTKAGKLNKISKTIHYRLRVRSEEDVHKERDTRLNEESFRSSQYKCVTCIEVFGSQEEIDQHLKKHAKFLGNYLCNICEQSFNFKSAHKNHMEEHYRCYECDKCQFRCVDLQSMAKHYKQQHTFTPRKCCFCHKEFISAWAYQVHRRWLHKQDTVCLHCNRRYEDNRLLKHHVLSYHKQRVQGHFKCDVCGKSSSSAYNLKQHIQLVHTERPADEAAFCVECGKQFKSVLIYQHHLTSAAHVPSDLLPFQCTLCSARLRSEGNLRAHMESKHTDGMNYFCEECAKGFKTMNRLNYHRKYTHEGKMLPKNKICDFCGRGFSSMKILTHHIRTHTGERPFACVYCEARFAQKTAMVTHMRAIHGRKRDGSMVDNTARKQTGNDI